MPQQTKTERKTPTMLRYFSVENYVSFKDKADIDFQLTDCDASQGWSVPSPNGGRLSTAIGILGANGSGKTNLLSALAFIHFFIKRSFSDIEHDAAIPLLSWFNNDAPVRFELETENKDGICFSYTLQATRQRVIKEALSQKKTSRAKEEPIFTREWKGESYEIDWVLEDLKNIPKDKIRASASIPSTLLQFGVTLPFLATITDNNLGAKRSLTKSANAYAQDPDFRKKADQFLEKIDVGLKGFRFQEVQQPDPKTGEMQTSYFLSGRHYLKDEEKPCHVPLPMESEGTIVLFSYLPSLFSALEEGGSVIIDELEKNLHPALVELLLDLFDNPDTNPKGAQIIFSSHMPDLIDFLGKSHIYLTEKTDQKSEVYPLSAFEEARLDQKLARLYLAGKFGAVPYIEEIDL